MNLNTELYMKFMEYKRWVMEDIKRPPTHSFRSWLETPGADRLRSEWRIRPKQYQPGD